MWRPLKANWPRSALIVTRFADVGSNNCELEILHERHVSGIRRVSLVTTFMVVNSVMNVELRFVNIPHVMLRSTGALW
jgi:hypothetical protein